MSAIQRTHVLERTSPIGGPFVGRCTLCGEDGLGLSDARRECLNPAGIKRDHALIGALEGPTQPDEEGKDED